jgi:hypothetical protein
LREREKEKKFRKIFYLFFVSFSTYCNFFVSNKIIKLINKQYQKMNENDNTMSDVEVKLEYNHNNEPRTQELFRPPSPVPEEDNVLILDSEDIGLLKELSSLCDLYNKTSFMCPVLLFYMNRNMNMKDIRNSKSLYQAYNTTMELFRLKDVPAFHEMHQWFDPFPTNTGDEPSEKLHTIVSLGLIHVAAMYLSKPYNKRWLLCELDTHTVKDLTNILPHDADVGYLISKSHKDKLQHIDPVMARACVQKFQNIQPDEAHIYFCKRSPKEREELLMQSRLCMFEDTETLARKLLRGIEIINFFQQKNNGCLGLLNWLFAEGVGIELHENHYNTVIENFFGQLDEEGIAHYLIETKQFKLYKYIIRNGICNAGWKQPHPDIIEQQHKIMGFIKQYAELHRKTANVTDNGIPMV